MERYSTYKDSGVQWLGEIPSHWEVVPLKYCMILNNGRDYKEYESNNGIPVIGTGGQFAYSNKEMFNGEVVFFGRKGTIDKPFHYKGAFWAVDTVFYAEAKSNMICRYLYYLGTTIPFGLYSTSTAIPSMTQTDLLNNPISLPSLAEQQAIAEYLDTVTSKIDIAIAQQQKMIDLLNERKQIIINNAVTKGLNPNVKMKDSGVDWIGEIPEEWEISKFKFHGSIKSGDGIKNEDVRAEGEYPVWGGNGLMGYHNKFNIEKNAFVIGRVGALCGNVRYVEDPVFVTDNALIFQILSTLEHKFLYYVMIAADFNRLNTSNAQPLITGTKVKNVSFAYPSDSEQIRIVEFIDNKLNNIKNGIAVISKQISLLQERKQIIINEVVTGKVKVTK